MPACYRALQWSASTLPNLHARLKLHRGQGQDERWHKMSGDDACLAPNFRTAEANKGRKASFETCMVGGTLHLGIHMPGLWSECARRDAEQQP